MLIDCRVYTSAPGADPGMIRVVRLNGQTVEPPKVKQTQIFWPYFFLWKKNLLKNNNKHNVRTSSHYILIRPQGTVIKHVRHDFDVFLLLSQSRCF